MNKPKIPAPIPPANPATRAYDTPEGGGNYFSRLASPIGIFTSTAGLTSTASGQKRSLIGG